MLVTDRGVAALLTLARSPFDAYPEMERFERA
jgi:hypothetical protein